MNTVHWWPMQTMCPSQAISTQTQNMLFCSCSLALLYPKPSQRTDLLIQHKYMTPFTAAVVGLPGYSCLQPSHLFSRLVDWNVYHMLFQANDDVRECNLEVASAAAPGKHSLCYWNKRKKGSFQSSPSLCRSQVICLLQCLHMCNIGARYCCHWDSVNLA